MNHFIKRTAFIIVLVLFMNLFTNGRNIIFAYENGGQPPATESIKKYSTANIENDTLILVNKSKSLSGNYVPDTLRQVKARCSPKILLEQKLMQDEAAKFLEEMFNAADKSKIRLYCVSGYRSYNTQNNVYKYKIKTLGMKMVRKYVAYPGNSEHQTGFAMDITNRNGLNKSLTEDFADTKEGKWLKNNAYKYGFIIRYPKGKEKITGYSYEPWHVRYVGKEAAEKITKNKITLEEYIEKLNKQQNTAIAK